jgi:hypothetical protein
MTTFLKTTSVTNITTQDPVQGLVDYVLDIKPYHTKIVEVLIEYIHTDPINVSVLENFQLAIGLHTLDITPVYTCGFGVAYDPLVPSTPYSITGMNGTNNYFTIAGNHTAEFVYGYPFLVSGTGVDDGILHTLYSTFASGSTQIYTIEDIIGTGALGILRAHQIGYGDPTYCALETDSGMFANVVISERLMFGFGEDPSNFMLSFHDTIFVDRVVENQDPGAYGSLPFGSLYDTVAFNSATAIGAFDYPMWDVGGFDEDINTLSIVYNNTI